MGESEIDSVRERKKEREGVKERMRAGKTARQRWKDTERES